MTSVYRITDPTALDRPAPLPAPELLALLPQLREVLWFMPDGAEAPTQLCGACEALLGLDGSVLQSHPRAWHALVLPGEQAAVQQARLRADDQPFEYSVRRPDGTLHRVRERCRALPGGRGGVIEDVEPTYREHELRQACEQARRAQSELMARAAHELRTPLNAMLGFAQLLQIGLAPAAAAQSQLRHLMDAGWRLRDLVQDLLDLSHARGGRLRVAPAALALRPLLQQALADAEPLARPHEVTLSLQPGEELTVWADALRVRQVLDNLLSNAIKYNRSGGHVRVRLKRVEAGARIEVRDTGLGIEAAQLHKLFTPFERLGRERSPVEGSGLGLALSRELAEAMHGRLTVASVAGRGTVAALELPLALGTNG